MAVTIKEKQTQNKCIVCSSDVKFGYICNGCRDKMMGKPAAKPLKAEKKK